MFSTLIHPGDYEGHKWNLKTLWKYFDEEIKIPWKPIWEDIKVGLNQGRIKVGLNHGRIKVGLN